MSFFGGNFPHENNLTSTSKEIYTNSNLVPGFTAWAPGFSVLVHGPLRTSVRVGQSGWHWAHSKPTVTTAIRNHFPCSTLLYPSLWRFWGASLETCVDDRACYVFISLSPFSGEGFVRALMAAMGTGGPRVQPFAHSVFLRACRSAEGRPGRIWVVRLIDLWVNIYLLKRWFWQIVYYGTLNR